jgi:hypothetical protein
MNSLYNLCLDKISRNPRYDLTKLPKEVFDNLCSVMLNPLIRQLDGYASCYGRKIFNNFHFAAAIYFNPNAYLPNPNFHELFETTLNIYISPREKFGFTKEQDLELEESAGVKYYRSYIYDEKKDMFICPYFVESLFAIYNVEYITTAEPLNRYQSNQGYLDDDLTIINETHFDKEFIDEMRKNKFIGIRFTYWFKRGSNSKISPKRAKTHNCDLSDDE